MLAKSVEVDIQGTQESGNGKAGSDNLSEGAGISKEKQSKAKAAKVMEGLRMSSRLIMEMTLKLLIKLLKG